MTFLDICAGIGGFRLGLEQAGHRCIGLLGQRKYRNATCGALDFPIKTFPLQENSEDCQEKEVEFTDVLSEISEAGYDAKWQVLNTGDYGIPQNRERVFIIGFLRNLRNGS